ncbi:ABC transporter ATP-binding protein [Opitutales bacterium ASA1]|uniref:ABC transporter ATP-binding protein n=1 Tax=Congregicoccus parvus TaxID=3081749 RepID=UPI002B2AFC02|nr:ABC transporter ATP-binding protein [Opitutales bacterium ASA1]
MKTLPYPDSGFNATTAVVEAVGVSRFYGMILGLNNVSFRIERGITGVVGPNGAGKTTLFRLLTGQLRPGSGTIRVFGEAPWNNPRVLARLGYCPESEEVPRRLRPREWLEALALVSGLTAPAARARAEVVLDRVRLARAHWTKRLGEMSKGMKQRVKLAQCLLHGPDLVVLDEPMNGLDPMGREEFCIVLRELAHAGATVIVSSHILHDLEALCGTFLLLRGGRMPKSVNEAAAPAARARRPAATTIRCSDPEALARYLFDQRLVRGCEFDAAAGLLHVQWADAEAFHARFHEHLLASGVEIFEVRSTRSFLEKAIQPVSTT